MMTLFKLLPYPIFVLCPKIAVYVFKKLHFVHCSSDEDHLQLKAESQDFNLIAILNPMCWVQTQHNKKMCHCANRLHFLLPS